MDQSPVTLSEQEYSYSRTKHTKKPFIVGGLVAFLVFGAIIWYAVNLRSNSTQKSAQNVHYDTMSPTSKPTVPSPAVIGFNSYEGNFSFKHPVPPICNGCYENPGGNAQGTPTTTIPGIWIVSYKSGLGPSDGDWALSVQKLPNALKGSYTSVTIPSKQFFALTDSLKIDETVPFTPDIGGGSYTITRHKNVAVESRVANVYVSTYSARSLARTKYLVFPSIDGTSTYVAEFEWTSPDDDYIFNLFTLSFQESLLPQSEVRDSNRKQL
ncbi:hypothetical protein HYS00_01475 [Candidatus Microgenomates bacterium]|nr:hypothetical protein [Candidatus Microgenomates bacterium]